jgi:hypothetical protein
MRATIVGSSAMNDQGNLAEGGRAECLKWLRAGPRESLLIPVV